MIKAVAGGGRGERPVFTIVLRKSYGLGRR